MPRLQRLLAQSTFGTLRSTDPPITVPAWAVMFSGMDPGTLGLYGFRHRRPGTYWENYIPSSTTPRAPMVWDILSRAGKRVCVMGMPPGYPPPHVNGVYVSDFLTPSSAKEFVFPLSLGAEIQRVARGYPFDVTFRAKERDRISRELSTMTQKHFAVARHLWTKEDWDFFALHEIGPDRLHHTFWKFFDQDHPRYEANPKFLAMVEEYYSLLDLEIGRLLDAVPDDVRVMVLSDHGSQAMQGCFCINEWLIRQGYLALKRPHPPAGTPLERADVDWSRTKAWGFGGYYARIFYNIRGREPHGILFPEDVPDFEENLVRELSAVQRPGGGSLDVEARPPRSLYHEVHGDPPDLMVYFGNLSWRSAGTVGYNGLFLEENDTGPDDSVHSLDGVYAVSGVSNGRGEVGGTERIIDIGPTILGMMGLPIPNQIQGHVIERFR